jgi:hypothetical protein
VDRPVSALNRRCSRGRQTSNLGKGEEKLASGDFIMFYRFLAELRIGFFINRIIRCS